MTDALAFPPKPEPDMLLSLSQARAPKHSRPQTKSKPHCLSGKADPRSANQGPLFAASPTILPPAWPNRGAVLSDSRAGSVLPMAP